MITEDYVSFETAKLLKERGFDISLMNVYSSYGEPKVVIEANWNDKCLSKANYCLRPTLQMSMKWLREVHGIYIDISIYVITKNIIKYNTNVYYKKNKNDSMYLGIHLTKEYSKYEEAAESGIKYCLENLI